MKNKILIPLVVIGVLGAFFSFKYGGGDGQTNEEKKVLILETVMKTIKEGHYSPRTVDDSFSYKVYHKLLDEMDAEKKFFTQADINALKPYELQIDDEIRNGSVEFYQKFAQIFMKRVDDAEKYSTEILKTPFTFNGKDSIELTGDKLAYAADDAALQERWKEFLKYRVLGKYVDLKKAQEGDKDKKKTATDKKDKADKTAAAPAKKKTDAELEVQARESVAKNQKLYFKFWHKMKDDDLFARYVNTITNAEDPHTDYFPPKEKDKFDVMMSGTFFGIGATLKADDAGKVKIMSVLTGSPSWKQGELKTGDEIQKVAQGDKAPVEVEGMDIEDVISLIRGPKGTEVRLTVKKIDNSTRVIPIIRGEVVIEETFARSAIINSKDGPIGYIYLPEFYADFQHINGPRAATDVEKEVIKLKNAGVKGMILDLRNNGGGSLSDVVDMAGIFVGGGPVVQVKSSDAAPSTLRAPNRPAIYDGPLAVMVNRGSASASEIMAAALQDYKRAVVVGATTYGKGTVQKLIPLDEFIDPATRARMQQSSDLATGGKTNGIDIGGKGIGSLKITMQKFYRVNGGSTQLHGVTPDIYLPDPYELVDNGERSNKSALPYDEIPQANYKPDNMSGNVAELSAMSHSRIAANPTFTLIQETAKRLKKQEDDNTVSLNEVAYRKEMEEANATSKKLEELQKKTTPFEIINPKEDLGKVNADTASVAKNKDWIKNLKKDVYISETVNIVNDMAKSGMKMNIGTGMK